MRILFEAAIAKNYIFFAVSIIFFNRDIVLAQSTVRNAHLGVSAVCSFDAAPSQRQRIGSCFLVDSELGWFCTAAHVLAGVAHKETRSAYVELSRESGFGPVQVQETKLIRCNVIAVGYDYVTLGTPDTLSTNDWALLEVADPTNIIILNQLVPVPLSPEYSRSGMIDIATLQPAGKVYGINQDSPIAHPSSGGELSSQPEPNGLWFTSCPAPPGWSGAPFIHNEQKKAFGIMLGWIGSDISHSYMVPCYSFLEAAAMQIPLTARTTRIAQMITNSACEQTSNVNLDAIVDRDLAQCNAVEHWQIALLLDKITNSTGAALVFKNLLGQYLFKNRWQLKGILAGQNTALKKALLQFASGYVDYLRTNNDVDIDASKYDLPLAIFSEANLAVRNDQLNDLDRRLIAKAKFDDIFIRATIFHEPRLTADDYPTVIHFSKYLRGTADVPIALVQVDKELAQGEKREYALLALSRDLRSATNGEVNVTNFPSNGRFYGRFLKENEVAYVAAVNNKDNGSTFGEYSLSIASAAREENRKLKYDSPKDLIDSNYP